MNLMTPNIFMTMKMTMQKIMTSKMMMTSRRQSPRFMMRISNRRAAMLLALVLGVKFVSAELKGAVQMEWGAELADATAKRNISTEV